MSKSKTRDWESVNAKEVTEAKSSDRYIQKERCGCSYPIHTFRTVGEKLEGRLRPCIKRDRDDRAKTAHICFEDDNSQEVVVCIRQSAMIQKAISKYHLFGKWVRITYEGNKLNRFGHHMKIFHIEVDKGAITEDFETCNVTPEQCKSRKPRKPKPIRRPLKNILLLILLFLAGCQSQQQPCDCMHEKRIIAIMAIKAKMDYNKIQELESLVGWYMKKDQEKFYKK